MKNNQVIDGAKNNGDSNEDLCWALLNNNIVKIKKLLSEKVDVNATVKLTLKNNSEDEILPIKPIMCAKSREAAELMYKAGATLDCIGAKNNTPLLVTSELGVAEVVDFLLEHKEVLQQVNFPNADGVLPIMATDNIEIAQKLLNKGSVLFTYSEENGHNNVLLSSCGEENELELIKFFLLNGAKELINEQDIEGWTPVIVAKNLESIKLLEGAGADLVHIMPDGNNILLGATYDSLEIAEYLLDNHFEKMKSLVNIPLKNGNFKSKTFDEYTPLLLIANDAFDDDEGSENGGEGDYNSENEVEDDNSENDNEYNISKGLGVSLKIFADVQKSEGYLSENDLEEGNEADANSESEAKHDEIRTQLTDTFTKKPGEEYIEKLIKVIKKLIGAGANINHQNSYDETALILAVVEGHEEVVKVLIASGAKLDLKDANGRTASYYADESELNTLFLELGEKADEEFKGEEVDLSEYSKEERELFFTRLENLKILYIPIDEVAVDDQKDEVEISGDIDSDNNNVD